MDVSIVITTCNRAESLRATLHALRWQTYRRFEVIVVQNPCDDHTSEVLEQFAGQIRLVQCPERNASLARNLGIAQAAGQIIGFLDDDSIPDPLWLADIVAGYDSPTIGGVGGLVLGHTGRNIHTEYCVVNRRGVPRQDLRPPLWAYQQPGCDEYVHLLGANSSYRRSALLEVGGLDEEMKIHLDETILCLKLVDRGYRVRILPRAVVAHRYMPGHLRGADRIILRPYQVVKNTFYYALQHARPPDRMPEVLRDCMRVVERMVRIGEEQFALGQIDSEQYADYRAQIDRAIRDGLERGLAPRIAKPLVCQAVAPLHLYPTVAPPPRRFTLCVLAADADEPLSPQWYAQLRTLAEAGHEIHTIERTPDQTRTDLEAGVWVHRVEPLPVPWPDAPGWVPFAAAAHAEVQWVGRDRPVDLVILTRPERAGLYCEHDERLRCIILESPADCTLDRLTTLLTPKTPTRNFPPMTPLQLASGLTVSVVAGTNLTRVQPELNLLRNTAQREQLLLHLRCYTPVCPVPSDARQYTVEQVGCLASDEHFGQSDLIVYHFPDCGRLIESIHFAPRRARVVVVFTGLMREANAADQWHLAAHLQAADAVVITDEQLRDELDRLDVPSVKVRQVAAAGAYLCEMLLNSVRPLEGDLVEVHRQAWLKALANLRQPPPQQPPQSAGAVEYRVWRTLRLDLVQSAKASWLYRLARRVYRTFRPAPR
jgi:GT2 family glycosyltransferase